MPKNPKQKSKTSLRFSTKLSLVIVLLIGLYLRIEPALFKVTHFSFDQGLDQILVKKLVEDHSVSLISRYTGLEGVFMGPWYTWFLVPPYLFSGGHPSANIIYLALFGIASIIWAYFLVKNMVGSRTTAAIFAFLLLLSPEHVSASVIFLNPNALHFLVVPYLYSIFQILKNRKYKHLVFLALLVSLFFQLEIGFAVFAFMAAFIVIIFSQKTSILKSKWFYLAIFVFTIPFIPQIAFDLRHDHIITNSIQKYFTGENTSLGDKLPLISRIPDRIKMLSSDFASAIGYRLNNPIAVAVSLIMVAFGWWLNFKNKYKQNIYLGKIVFILVVLFYLGFLVYPGPIWGWYRAGLPTLMLLISALSLSAYYFAGGTVKKILYLYIIFMFFIGIHIPGRHEIWSGNYKDQVSTLRVQHQVIDSIYQDASGKTFALYIYTPPVYTYIWDYQFHWYAKNKYGYLPNPYDIRPILGNPELVYLIREPDDNKERVAGWIGNFKAVGRPLKTWQMPAGITVEKWRFEKEPDNGTPIVKFVDALSKQ